MNGLINIIKTNKGTFTVTTREVANKFNKQHREILRTVRDIMTSVENYTHLFIESNYKDSYNRNQTEYLLTRDGFSLLAMGFTGNDALKWKLKFIEAFNKMELKLLQVSEKDKLLVSLFSSDPMVVAQSHKALVELETKPLVEQINNRQTVIDSVINDDALFSVNDVGRMLKSSCVIMGANKIFEYLRSERILFDEPNTARHNTPYAKYEKYLNVKIIYKNEHAYYKSYFTGKGLKWFLNRLVSNNLMTNQQKQQAEQIFK